MRRLHVAIGSLAVHAMVLTWLAYAGRCGTRPERRRKPVIIELVDVPPTPTAAPQALGAHATPVPTIVEGPPPRPVPGRPRRPTATAAISVAPRPEATLGEPARPEVPVAPVPVTPVPPKRSAMSMRDERPSMTERLVDQALAQPDPGPLPDYPGLRSRVALEGVHSRLRDPSYVENASPDKVAADRIAMQALRAERDAQEMVLQRDGTYRTEKETFVATVAPDGKVAFQDKANLRREGLGARFDVTDWAMRSVGNDPYSSAKREFLDRTRDQRVELGKVHRKELLSRSVELMSRNLESAWARLPHVAARKEAAFELWDECAETGDAALVEGGRQARAFVVRFIQIKLRGADAYTTAELARFNAQRRSKERFAPYD